MKRKLISLIFIRSNGSITCWLRGLVMMEQPQVRQQIRPPSQKVTMWDTPASAPSDDAQSLTVWCWDSFNGCNEKRRVKFTRQITQM